MQPIESGQASRRLVVIRHARAESWGESDHARVLASTGVADAEAAGEWLLDQGVTPDHALVSGAQRTRDTWAALAEGAGWSLEPEYDEALYSAGHETALDIIRGAPADAQVLVVIGHNPTMASLAQLLDDGEGDPQAGVDMTMGFPPCALAVFDVDGDWSGLANGAATLQAFHVGRRAE